MESARVGDGGADSETPDQTTFDPMPPTPPTPPSPQLPCPAAVNVSREGWGGTGDNDTLERGARMNKGISTSTGNQWTLFGRRTQQSKVVYFTQATILYILIITSLVNITLESKNLNLWSTLLASAIGYLLPAPQLKERTANGGSGNYGPR